MYLRRGLLIALFMFASDVVTKWLVIEVLMDPPRVIEVLPFFSLTLGFNRGISFGLLASQSFAAPYLLSALALIIVGFLTVWLRRSNQIGEVAGIGTIIGGASANIVDRLEDGAVTDFLDFHIGAYHWPTFNIADVAVVLGVVLLVVRALFYNQVSR